MIDRIYVGWVGGCRVGVIFRSFLVGHHQEQIKVWFAASMGQ